ncbi:unnamed protein product [Merluccius merluccius]
MEVQMLEYRSGDRPVSMGTDRSPWGPTGLHGDTGDMETALETSSPSTALQLLFTRSGSAAGCQVPAAGCHVQHIQLLLVLTTGDRY